jgi:NADP-dependent 3-hydroxy acid dehydrogenase YdfG
MKVQNKVLVITGSGNGMGREVALNLLSKGASVAAVDINESALQETIGLAGNKKDKLSTHVVDITDGEAVGGLPEQVISRHGAVDGLINNAGIIQPFVRVKDLDYAAIKRVMNINFFGTLYVTKAFLPHLLKRRQAHIANVSSMGGFLPVPGQTVYGASKAAVKLFTEGLRSELLDTNVEGLRSELLDTNVRVTVIFPGAVGTNIAANSGVEIGSQAVETGDQRKSFKPLAPSKAAEIIVDGIERDRYRIFVGSDAAFMDFIYRLSPERAANYIFKQMKSLLPE